LAFIENWLLKIGHGGYFDLVKDKICLFLLAKISTIVTAGQLKFLVARIISFSQNGVLVKFWSEKKVLVRST